MKRLSCLLLCLLFPCASFGASAWDVSKRAEGSIVVTGSIVVKPDGSVASYTLDHQDKLPSAVVAVIDKTLPAWKFQPILMLDSSNKPELAKASMSLRVIAKPVADDQYDVSLGGASFGYDDKQSSEGFSYKHTVPPRYPMELASEGISGIVYLLVRVGAMDML